MNLTDSCSSVHQDEDVRVVRSLTGSNGGSIGANVSIFSSTSSSLLPSSISEVSLHAPPFACLTISLPSMSPPPTTPSSALLMESFFRVRPLNYCNGVSDTGDLNTNKDWGGCWRGGGGGTEEHYYEFERNAPVNARSGKFPEALQRGLRF